MIDFFKRTTTYTEIDKLQQWYNMNGNIPDFRSGCRKYFTENFNLPNFFVTKSCTQSLELALTICSFEPGSEILLPSYAFVSLANAIALRGLKCVFVDCEKDTLNIDPNVIEEAITHKTKAIITINYGGVACNYAMIRQICNKYDLILIEDNAHGIRAKYNNQWLGSLGDISTISFDFLKNISCNEGGGITINNEALMHQFRISYEFGTNKLDFLEGKAPFYEWKGLGSNHALAEPLAAILFDQLENSGEIIKEFLRKWHLYYKLLSPLEQLGLISLVKIPAYSHHNGHMFWMKTINNDVRTQLMSYLRERKIHTAFHYTPLHSSEFGLKNGEFRGIDLNTSSESSKLIRLPLYYSLKDEELNQVVENIFNFYDVVYNP